MIPHQHKVFKEDMKAPDGAISVQGSQSSMRELEETILLRHSKREQRVNLQRMKTNVKNTSNIDSKDIENLIG